ncbi:hypothetical protein VC83_00692 [Pseudogymnoascus destructans]|uniref:Uncharacterized protein n=2 Tax=Pseudogymnoascus destructans TaxID=655981 RepID=L8FYG4_PSED2|nr:uncharacterized protein VC83_00692 [Pseudogymnoascus destructans]ELR04731.1 hypothetical protein GMDG_06960 [Pseudogymnoascus destructans 20631-21]OAF62447.1 hypothetical protein VC83_00692 [Pseudogymnoascus destructans]
MSRSQDLARALRTEKTRREAPLTSGISSFKRNFSKTIRIGRTRSQQDDTILRMSTSQSKQRTKRNKPAMDDELPRTNGHTGSQSNNAPSVSQPETDLSPLAQELRGASEQLSNIQNAIRAISASCIQHADHITQIPEWRERYENLRKEVENKDITIADQQTTLNVLNKMASEKDKAAERDVEDFLAKKKSLEQDQVELDQQKRAAAEALKEKESKLKAEVIKTISRRAEEQDKKFHAQMKALEIDMEKQKKDQEEELGNLKAKTKKDAKTITELKAQIDELRLQSKKEVERYEDEKRLKEVYKQDIEGLEEKLKDLQEEFSLNSEPIEYYQGEFLNISRAIQDISVRYLARDLNKEEVVSLPGAISVADSTFSDVPFSNTDTSKQLRIAHGQRVVADAICNIVWQPFSSDITSEDSKLSKLLQDIGGAVGTGRSADVWRAVTMRALKSTSIAHTQPQHSPSQTLSAVPAIKSREDKLMELVLSVLGPLLDPSDLLQFKANLLQITKQAISVWTTAQADERTFTVNPKLNQGNKRDWKIAALNYAALYSDGGSQVVGPRRRNATSVFTLFPIISATKRVQAQKAGHGPPGSWPDQDQQQVLNPEVTLIHDGLGLPQESDIVREGISEREEFIKMRLAHEELWDQKIAQKVAEKGPSRNNSTAGTISGPPSHHKTGN